MDKYNSNKKAVQTDLFASKAPLEWAIIGNNTLYTAQIPIDNNGVVVSGGIEQQSIQTIENLKHTLSRANTTFDDVFQVLIYVTNREYLATFNRVYAQYFNKKPYPNRAAVVVAGLAREEMLVELVVYANAN